MVVFYLLEIKCMTTQKQPTNQDLLKEIRTMNDTLLQQDGRLGAIEHRHELIDVGKEAVAKYKREEDEERRNKVKDGIANTQLKTWHVLLAIALVVSAILYAYAAGHGIKTP